LPGGGGESKTSSALWCVECHQHHILKARPKHCEVRKARRCLKYSSKSMTSESTTKGINSSWIYFCWIKHQPLKKSSHRLHEGFLGLWSGSGNSTLICNFCLGWYKAQNYWFVNFWISSKIVFEELDIPSATFQSTCTEGAFPNSLHSTSVVQLSLAHLSPPSFFQSFYEHHPGLKSCYW